MIEEQELANLGFTGTRAGWTIKQQFAVLGWIEQVNIKFLRHGVCTGSDHLFHSLVRDKQPDAWITGYPPLATRYMCRHCYDDCNSLEDPADYLVRDANIVARCAYLLATPKESYELMRGSGTWATIRYARKAKRPHWIIYPDGRIEFFEGRNQIAYTKTS